MCQPNYKHDTREASRVTFVAMCLAFAKREKFSAAQVVVLFKICWTLLMTAARSLPKADAQQGAYLSHYAGIAPLLPAGLERA
jgi:hypothetical protein